MATLGTPAFATPGSLNLREVQQAVDAIRARFTRLEAAVNLNESVLFAGQKSSSSSLGAQIAALRQEVADLTALVVGGGGDWTLALLADSQPPIPADVGFAWPRADDASPQRESDERLLWPDESAAPIGIDDANALLAARVFSGD